MTTNKPEVVAWLHATRQESEVITDKMLHVWGTPLGSMAQYTVALIRLSDYEALQADYEKLRKHLQNLIDQTTPLEPEPGNPMWSRRIQLDEVMAERDKLREELVEALSALRGCITETRGPDAHSALVLADTALAAYRNQGENQ